MTAAVRILDLPRGGGTAALRRLSSSREAITRALDDARAREVWILESEQGVTALIGALVGSSGRARRARLISYARPGAGPARILEATFARALVGPEALVPLDDLREILATPHPEDYCIGAEWDSTTRTVALWRGDLTVVVEPLSEFRPCAGVAPDPRRLTIVDCGQTIRLGEYEAAVDAVLWDRDPLYRRRAKKRMIREERTIGASIRRLRISRGVAREDFPGLDEKTLARIERGEVSRPHRRTMEAIAKRLRVTVEELLSY